MSDYTKELLKHLTYVGNASRRLINTNNLQKKAPSQQRVLDILAEEDGLEQGVLAEILDIRPSSLTEILKKLEARGEINRVEDENDKRIRKVFITDAGLAKVTPASKLHDRSEEFLAGLTEEEQIELDGLLNKMVNGWTEEFSEASDMPNMPFDAIEKMREMHKHFEDEFMEDWQDLTPQERREKKREMRDKMRNRFGNHNGFGGGRRNPINFDWKGFYGYDEDGRRPDDFDDKQDGDWENW